MSRSFRTWTVLDVLRWTATWLGRRGVQNPRLDAELLLAHTLGGGRLGLYTAPDKPLTSEELARFKELVRQRAAGRCVAHLIGRKEFWKHSFLTPPGVFVPRPETELLVEETLAFTRERPEFRLLDLCTGSGAVAVSILADRQKARGTAVDVSATAAAVAADNAAAMGVAGRLEIVCADAPEYLSHPVTPFDVVTCNPPYVPTAEWERLAPEIRDHEPRTAVDGGNDGLDLLLRMVPLLPQALTPGGLVAVEYAGSAQTGELGRAMEAAGLSEVRVVPDLAGEDRVMCARFRP